VVGIDVLDSVRPWRDVDAVGRTEVEQHRPGVVEQLEDSSLAMGCGQVEVWHAASEQWVSLAEVVAHVEPGQEPG